MTLCVAIALFLVPTVASAGAFGFARVAEDPNIITHPAGYVGTGGTITRTVCIDPMSANAQALVYPASQAVKTINELTTATSNQKTHPELTNSQHDSQSVITHELLHCTYGLGHSNLVLVDGSPETNYTTSLKGPNGMHDIISLDNTQGNEEDFRGDDINLHWFRIGDNNPLLVTGPADSTTLSANTDDLPMDHFFAVNTNIETSADLGFPATIAMMYSTSTMGFTRRELSPDDQTTIQLSRSGIDRTAGTADDVSLQLNFIGIKESCDIPITIDSLPNPVTGRCSSGAKVIVPTVDHYQILNTRITLSDVAPFYFESSDEVFADDFEFGNLDRWDDVDP